MTRNSNDPNKRRELQMPTAQASKVRKTGSESKPVPSVKSVSTDMKSASASNARNSSSSHASGSKKKRTMTKKKKFKALYICLAVVLLLSIGSLVAAQYVVPLIKAATGFKQEKIEPDEIYNPFSDNSESAAHMSGYLNIAVFGIDTRAKNESADTQIDDSDSRSDVIMIISVNRENNQVKILSVYRDTYLYSGTDKNGKEQFDKINHGYAKGKAVNAINLLNKNLDLNLTDFVTVDFSIVAQCIDAVGGIEIEVEEKEIEKFNKNGTYKTTYPLLNHYIDEINELTGSNSPHITEPGVHQMDGVQATAFARVRYCDTDYERTARQREVLMKLFEKAKNQSISQILKLAEIIAPQVVTSLEWSEIAELAKYALNCEIVDQQGFPFNPEEVKLDKVFYVFSKNLTEDVKQLHSYLFNEQDYQPTNTLQSLSDMIDKKRGKTTPYDDDDDDDDDDSSSSTTKKNTPEPAAVPDDDDDDTDQSYSSNVHKTTQTPSEYTAAPAYEPDPPEDDVYDVPPETLAPVQTPAPVVQTQTPVVQTQAPVVQTQAPVVHQTEQPVTIDDTQNDGTQTYEETN